MQFRESSFVFSEFSALNAIDNLRPDSSFSLKEPHSFNCFCGLTSEIQKLRLEKSRLQNQLERQEKDQKTCNRDPLDQQIKDLRARNKDLKQRSIANSRSTTCIGILQSLSSQGDQKQFIRQLQLNNRKLLKQNKMLRETLSSRSRPYR